MNTIISPLVFPTKVSIPVLSELSRRPTAAFSVLPLLAVLATSAFGQSLPPPPGENRSEAKAAAQNLRAASPVAGNGASESVVELSPFEVREDANQGYYATQTLAGGRLRQDLRDLATSVQVVTKDFMDDVGAFRIEELLQYTTNTEVAGILGNFTGAADQDLGGGAVLIDEARRDPDATSRIRGLAAPDRTRNFFRTEIPFDTYNTERIDINRGANSFLFGLGSPAGLINNDLMRANFRNSNEVSLRGGSGGQNLSWRASGNTNQVLIKDVLALRVAALSDRTQYRQRPTFYNDDRLYATVTYRPFKNLETSFRAHFEGGRTDGNSPDVLLPVENLSTFLNEPLVGRRSFDVMDNIRRFGHAEGPTQAQWNALSSIDRSRYIVRETPTPNSMRIGLWGLGAYGFIYDGANGREPSLAYTDRYPAQIYARGDPFWDPNNLFRGRPEGIYHGNLGQIKGTGWLYQGFTDLETFDFSRASLAWDNDSMESRFTNYSAAWEQILLKGKAGFEVSFDYQNMDKRDYTAFNSYDAIVTFDINETLMLPADPNYRTSRNISPVPNPNFGRPFIMSKATTFGRRNRDTERLAGRVTAFFKQDFSKSGPSGSVVRWLGRHAFSLLADRSRFNERIVNYYANSFGEPDPALHNGQGNARSSGVDPRNVPAYAYIGPQQLNAFTDPNFTIHDFILYPAAYTLQRPDGFSMKKLSWNLGPEVTNATIGLPANINGNEAFVDGVFETRWVPQNRNRLQRVDLSSYGANAQSFFLRESIVVNTGYRVDTVKTWLNTTPIPVGIDSIKDVSDDGWKLTDGNFIRQEFETFAYGAVFHLPKRALRVPEHAKFSVHYNASDNFIAETDRFDETRSRVAPPEGEGKDWGLTASFWGDRFVLRINRFESLLLNAQSTQTAAFNNTNNLLFSTFGFLNRDLQQLDSNNDGVLDNPAGTAQNSVFSQLKAARDALDGHLSPELRSAYSYRRAADGTSITAAGGPVTDTDDVLAKGTEFEATFNPSASWRITMNLAEQKTIRTNIAPRLTKKINDFLIPFLQNFGDLDADFPADAVSGNTIREQANARLLEYFSAKAKEGMPNPEQRRWRANLVTAYTFREGRVKGFSFGGAIRWEDRFAIGYPLLDDPRGLIVPDVRQPYFSEAETHVDLFFGFGRRLFGKFNWKMQVNIKNLENWDGDGVTVIRAQPDGSPARARFGAPAQVWVNNTFRF